MAQTTVPMVLSPAGSTCRARCSASEVARSALAGVTARMMALSPCRADGSANEDLCGLHSCGRASARWQAVHGCSYAWC